jgi:hypothetical protein
MAKQKQHEAEKALPPLGCEVCMPADHGGVVAPGYVIVQHPGKPRFMKPCECKIRREQAKKAQEAKA